jgi:hypothetical protein
MEKYFAITKKNKKNLNLNAKNNLPHIKNFKRKAESQSPLNFESKRNKNNKFDIKNLYKERKYINNNTNNLIINDNPLELEETDIQNEKIENIFQKVYFSDIPCSQIDNSSSNKENIINTPENLNTKDIHSTFTTNNSIDKENQTNNSRYQTNSNIINNNITKCIKQISLFDNIKNHERKQIKSIPQYFPIFENCNSEIIKNNKTHLFNNKSKIYKPKNNHKNRNDNTSNLNNLSNHVKRISIFDNTFHNNNSNYATNISIINKSITDTNNTNNISNNEIPIEEAFTFNEVEEKNSKKVCPPNQHIYILEDNKVKIVYEKSHNLSKEKDINNNFNNFDETKENIDLNQSKSMNNELVKKTNKTIYLKKSKNKVKNNSFNYTFRLSQVSSDEDDDIAKANFNFSSIIYDNPSTGAMKSCIGYVDPDCYKKEKNKNKGILKIRGGLRSFMDYREYKIGEQNSEIQVSNIFKGVVAYIDGFSRNCTDVELKRLIRIHGGKVFWYISKTRVTHVICSSLCESKIQNYLGSKVNHYKIVTDKWIIDSIKAKKRLSEAPYLTLNTLKKTQCQKSILDYIEK